MQPGRAGRLQGWFAKVKGAGDRYRDGPLCDKGLGWAWFDTGSPTRPTAGNFRAECVACHAPAQSSDWAYLQGYLPPR